MFRKLGQKPIVALLVCFASYCALYVSRSTISVFATALNEQGILTVAQYGIVGSLFFIVYAGGRMLNGYLSDIFDSKTMICTGVFLAGLSNLAIGLIRTAPVIFTFWCINAIGQSMVWSAILVLIVDKAEQSKKDLYISMLGSSVAFGTVLGIVIASRSYAIGGLKTGFVIPGIIGVAMALIALVLLPSVKNVRKEGTKAPFRLASAVKRKYLRLFLPIMVNGVMKDGINLWFVAYVITKFGIDVSSVAGYVFMVPFLGLVGRVLFTSFYRLLGKNEFSTAMVDYAISALVAIPLCLGTSSLVLTIVCFAIMFAFVSMANLSFVGMLPVKNADPGRIGLVSGSIDLLIYMGSGISSAVFGFVVSTYGYGIMFDIWFVLLVLSVVALGFYRPQKSKIAFVEG